MKLSELRCIGEKREKEFAALGITTAEDLVRLYPRAYLDLTERSTLKYAAHNETALIACELLRFAPPSYGGKRYVKAYCSQDGYAFTAVWFNQPYVASRLKAGEYLFYGRVQRRLGQVSVVNPTFEPLDKNYRLKGIVPVYSLKGKLSQKTVRDAVREALSPRFSGIVDPRKTCGKIPFALFGAQLFCGARPAGLFHERRGERARCAGRIFFVAFRVPYHQGRQRGRARA